jgi:hypothetical protein
MNGASRSLGEADVTEPTQVTHVACEYCRSEMSVDALPMVCSVCRTAHRFDAANQRLVVVASPPQVFERLVLFVLLAGAVCLIAPKVSSAAACFLFFIGFAIHLWNGWRTGVIRSNLGGLLAWARTIYRDEQPLAFQAALLIEGAWTLLLLLASIFLLGA